MEAPELFERMTPTHMIWLLPKLRLEDMRPCPVLEADVQQVLLVVELKAHDGAASDIYFSDGTYLFDRSKGSCHRVPPDFVRSFDPTQDN